MKTENKLWPDSAGVFFFFFIRAYTFVEGAVDKLPGSLTNCSLEHIPMDSTESAVAGSLQKSGTLYLKGLLP